jgi:large subunit ribosomal protein L35
MIPTSPLIGLVSARPGGSCDPVPRMVASARDVHYKAQASSRTSRSDRARQTEFSRMTKLKTKRSAAKRFRFTGTGKVKRNHAYHRHQLTHKAKKVKVGQRDSTIVADADKRMIKRMLPYGS